MSSCVSDSSLIDNLYYEALGTSVEYSDLDLQRYFCARELYEGESLIKSDPKLYNKYLPRKDRQTPRGYRKFVERAFMPNMVKPEIDRMVGTIFRQLPMVSVSALEEGEDVSELVNRFEKIFLDRITVKGDNITRLMKDVAKETILVGKTFLQFTINIYNNKPVYTVDLIPVEQILTYKVVSGVITAVVQDLSYNDVTTRGRKQGYDYRRLHIVIDGVYGIIDEKIIYPDKENARGAEEAIQFECTEFQPIVFRRGENDEGGTINMIPIFPCGKNGISFDVGKPELEHVINANKSIIVSLADLDHNVALSTSPVMHVKSNSSLAAKEELVEQRLNINRMLVTESDSQANYIELQGQSVAAAQSQIQMKIDMVNAAASKENEMRTGVESAETSRIRNFRQTQLVGEFAMGLENMFKVILDKVVQVLDFRIRVDVVFSQEFAIAATSIQDLERFADLLERGLVSPQLFVEVLVNTRITQRELAPDRVRALEEYIRSNLETSTSLDFSALEQIMRSTDTERVDPDMPLIDFGENTDENSLQEVPAGE